MNSKVTAISAALAAFVPWLIFAPRRFNRCFNENNPVNSVMDLQISAAQSANAYQGAKSASDYAKLGITEEGISAEKLIKNGSETVVKAEKSAGLLSKIWLFTKNNINKVIGIGQCAKVAFSDNKERDAIIEGSSFGGMLACEALANNMLGRPKTSFVNGKLVMTKREAKYKKYGWLTKLFKGANDFVVNLMNKNKNLSKYAKYVPGIGKGLMFAGASIGGFSGARSLATKVADEVTPLQQAA